MQRNKAGSRWYDVKGAWIQHSTDLILEIPISKYLRARIFSGGKIHHSPISVQVIDIFGEDTSRAFEADAGKGRYELGVALRSQ
jgi:hypothetical protein